MKSPSIGMSITLGYRCTLSCDHCLNYSGPERTESLSFNEINKLNKDIIKLQPREITLIGGEPTLYLKSINKILDNLPYIPEITVTTNGFFANSLRQTENVLNQIPYLKKINLSFDNFHKSKVGEVIPDNIHTYTQEHGIDYGIIICTSDYMKDLDFINELSLKYPDILSPQLVDGVGRAKSTKSEYQYHLFDESVLEQTCPNTGTVSYFPGSGYSVCCTNVVFNINDSRVYENEFSDLKENHFNKLVTQRTIGQRCKDLGISPPEIPRLSSVCNFCEFLAKKELQISSLS